MTPPKTKRPYTGTGFGITVKYDHRQMALLRKLAYTNRGTAYSTRRFLLPDTRSALGLSASPITQSRCRTGHSAFDPMVVRHGHRLAATTQNDFIDVYIRRLIAAARIREMLAHTPFSRCEGRRTSIKARHPPRSRPYSPVRFSYGDVDLLPVGVLIVPAMRATGRRALGMGNQSQSVVGTPSRRLATAARGTSAEGLVASAEIY